jgi:hypothetical protein
LHILSVCEGKKEKEGQSVQCQVIPYTAEDVLLIQISAALSGNTRNTGRVDKKRVTFCPVNNCKGELDPKLQNQQAKRKKSQERE